MRLMRSSIANYKHEWVSLGALLVNIAPRQLFPRRQIVSSSIPILQCAPNLMHYI